MPTSYLPAGEQDRAAWVLNFSQKLPSYATTLGLLKATVDGVSADAAYYGWVMQVLGLFRNYAQAWTAYKNALGTGTALGDPPVVPTIPPAPPAVAPNIFGRLTKLVATIKNAPGYTEAIGKDLGIISPESPKPDLNTLKPVLKPLVVAKGVELDWNKQGHRRLYLYIEVDRDGLGWHFLAIDSTPDYTDTTPITAPALWRYRAQYRLDDEPVGHWSDVVIVSVG